MMGEHSLSFESLYSECFRGVYRFVFARVQDMETAEDLTSETFLRAWHKWPPRVTTGLGPKAWLFQIARNLIIDHYRAAKRRPSVPLDEESLDDGDCKSDDGSNSGALAVRVALASLSLRDQEVLSLRLAGLSNQEIASTLNINEGAAGMACLRAMQRLRTQLEM